MSKQFLYSTSLRLFNKDDMSSDTVCTTDACTLASKLDSFVNDEEHDEDGDGLILI